MTQRKNDAIKIDGKKEAALLLRSLGSADRERILAGIAAQNPELAAELRKGLFPFTYFLVLEAIELQKVIRAIPPSLFALSLRGLEPTLKQMLFSKLSERQGHALEEEIESVGPRKLSEVKQAQEKIMEYARELHEKGEIHLKPTSE